jgi:hypothetical protein
LPAERRPPDPDQEQPDSDETPAVAEDEVPEEIRKLFVEKDGFCNFYFNEQQRLGRIQPLRKRTESAGSVEATWKIRFEMEGATPAVTGELAIGPKTIGMKLGDTAWLQQVSDPKAEEEPPGMSGMLIAMNQLRRLFSTDAAAFGEITAFGSTVHLPLAKELQILLSREGTRTGRWYFEDDEVLPVALDLEYETGIDEVRLVFEKWKDGSGVVFPERIGIVNSATEEISWLRITDAVRQD